MVVSVGLEAADSEHTEKTAQVFQTATLGAEPALGDQAFLASLSSLVKWG